RPPAPAPGRLQAEVGPQFFKSGLDIPAAGVVADHRPGAEARIGGEEVFVAVRALPVPDEHPPDRHQSPAGLVPVAGALGRLYPAGTAAVPGDRPPAEAPPPGDRLARLGQAAALDPRPALAPVARRRLEQVGVGVELADQGQARAMPPGEAGHLVGAVAGVADEEERAAGEAQ